MTGRRRLAKMARLIERDQILELLNIHSLSRLKYKSVPVRLTLRSKEIRPLAGGR